MGSVAIERYEASDQQGVIAMILAIQQEEFAIPITAADQPDLAAIPDFYQTGLGDFWVARADGAVVGSVGLKDIGNRQAALRKMFVAAPFRGAAFGVATKLLGQLLADAAARGVVDIFLGTTDKFRAAHRFYEKHGFVEVAPSILPESFPRMIVDVKFYHRSSIIR